MFYWILKTEPSTYSLSDLKKDGVTAWDGVRNYQARNNLKKMKVGDKAFIYHSVSDKAIVGIAAIVGEAFIDKTAADEQWVAVNVAFVSELTHPITLAQMKDHSGLKNLSLIKQGRLSVCPITKEEWELIEKLGTRR